MKKALEQDLNTPEFIAEFDTLLKGMTLVIEEHSQHEEFIIWPAFRALWPTMQSRAHIQHEIIDADQLANVRAFLDLYLASAEGDRAATLAPLKAAFTKFADSEIEHLKQEEDYLQSIGRKYISVPENQAIVRRAFFFTPLYKWRKIIAFQLTADFHYQRKIKFLKCLLWSLPEKTQTIGKMVYESVDQFLFQRLLVDLPELAPRNTAGGSYQRYY